MRARRVDQNLKNIVACARQLGFLVYVRNDELGDLDVQLKKRHEVWECKNGTGRFTETQKKYREQGWSLRTVRTIDDVLQAKKEMMW